MYNPVQVDFVAYIPNPYYARGKQRGAATREAAHLQHMRLVMQLDRGGTEAARAARLQVWHG